MGKYERIKPNIHINFRGINEDALLRVSKLINEKMRKYLEEEAAKMFISYDHWTKPTDFEVDTHAGAIDLTQDINGVWSNREEEEPKVLGTGESNDNC